MPQHRPFCFIHWNSEANTPARAVVVAKRPEYHAYSWRSNSFRTCIWKTTGYLTAVETMTPAQLSFEAPAPERQLESLGWLARQKFLAAKQSDDLRRDIASKLQLSYGSFFPGDKVFYWAEDKSKIKSDGSHGGKRIKVKLVSVDGSMVGVDLGTRIVKVNISKIREDHNPIEDVEVPLDPTALASADLTATSAAAAAKDACVATMKTRAEDFANTILKHDASLEGPEGIKYGNYMWEPVTHGKIDSLEVFSGSAKLRQAAASQGLRVGEPIDLRTGYDLLTADGRRRATEVIERQQPKFIHTAPARGPWSQMQNINDPADTWYKRKKYLPMVEFCAKDMSGLIDSQRSAVLFWNNDGSVPADHSKEPEQTPTDVDPPPGLDPPQQEPQLDDLTQHDIPPDDQHPPDNDMPQAPHTPHNNGPPDDDPLHHLGKCLLRLHPRLSLATIWGEIRSHWSHQTRPFLLVQPPATVAPSVSNAQKTPKPKDVAVPDDLDDDEPDPDAAPSGHNGPPLLPIDGGEPFNPAPMPDPDPPQETPDTDDTIPYGSTDADETLDYNDLVIEDDDKTWCF
eukprot:s108_g9.t1